MLRGSVTPASSAGTKSANSTQVAAAPKTSGATFRQRHTFDQNHSDEYVPPIGARYSGACCPAVSVMRSASSAAVWSFHNHAWAAGLASHLGSRASGRQRASTGIGVEPVVSTPMPTTRSREKPGSVGEPSAFSAEPPRALESPPSASTFASAPAVATRSPST